MINRRDMFKAFAGLGALALAPTNAIAEYTRNWKNERIIAKIKEGMAWACKRGMFELNDDFTQAVARSMLEPYLRDLQKQGEVYDWRVICDQTNNTQQVIDKNEFVVDVYVRFPNDPSFRHLNAITKRDAIHIEEAVGTLNS